MSEPLRVLLVDDNLADLHLAELAFEEHRAVAQVVTRDSGPAALTYLRDPATPLPHVVMLDLNMPMMNGFEVLEAIRTDPHLQHLSVVILSTSDADSDVKRAYSMFASSYMLKQDSFSDFIAQIDQFVTYWRQCQFAHVPKS